MIVEFHVTKEGERLKRLLSELTCRLTPLTQLKQRHLDEAWVVVFLYYQIEPLDATICKADNTVNASLSSPSSPN